MSILELIAQIWDSTLGRVGCLGWCVLLLGILGLIYFYVDYRGKEFDRAWKKSSSEAKKEKEKPKKKRPFPVPVKTSREEPRFQKQRASYRPAGHKRTRRSGEPRNSKGKPRNVVSVGTFVVALLLASVICLIAGGVLVRIFLPRKEQVRVVVVATATPIPTPTNTPGPSPTPSLTYTPQPTRTPTPTWTPTPTLTPIPTTPPDEVLQPGAWFYGNGLAVLLRDPVEKYPDKLRVTLVLRNTSKQEIFLELRRDMYRMVTNLDEVVYLGHSIKTGGIALKPGEDIVLSDRGVFRYNLANEEVLHVFVEFTGLQRLDRARWKVDIPH